MGVHRIKYVIFYKNIFWLSIGIYSYTISVKYMDLFFSEKCHVVWGWTRGVWGDDEILLADVICLFVYY